MQKICSRPCLDLHILLGVKKWETTIMVITIADLAKRNASKYAKKPRMWALCFWFSAQLRSALSSSLQKHGLFSLVLFSLFAESR